MTETAAAPLDPKDRRIKDLEHEVDMLTNAGVIECAVRNKSVSEYMEHWEGRATKAEQALALRGEPVAWMLRNAAGKIYWDEESCIWSIAGDSEDQLEYLQTEYPDEGWHEVALYAAPISGERVREALQSELATAKQNLTNSQFFSGRQIACIEVNVLSRVLEATALPLAAQPEGK